MISPCFAGNLFGEDGVFSLCYFKGGDVGDGFDSAKWFTIGSAQYTTVFKHREAGTIGPFKLTFYIVYGTGSEKTALSGGTAGARHDVVAPFTDDLICSKIAQSFEPMVAETDDAVYIHDK
jgi:hypothetical protein